MQKITQAEYALLSKEDKRVLEDAVIDLSPENLTCDGMLSGKVVHLRRQEVLERIKRIETKVGRIIPEEMIYNNLR